MIFFIISLFSEIRGVKLEVDLYLIVGVLISVEPCTALQLGGMAEGLIGVLEYGGLVNSWDACALFKISQSVM